MSKPKTTDEAIIDQPVQLPGVDAAITIPKLEKVRTTVKVRSINDSPFVPRAFGAKAEEELRNKHDGITPTKKKEPKDQWREFMESGYWIRNDKGEITSLAATTLQFKKATVDAVRHVGDRKTLTMAAVRSWFHVIGMDPKNPKFVALSSPPLPEHLWEETDYRFTGNEEGKKSKWATKERIKEMKSLHKLGISMRCDPCRVAAKSMDLRYRPAIHDWSAEFYVEYYPQFITLEGIVNLINIAGTLNGIGEWRPSSPQATGDWGMFEVNMED